MRATGKRWLAVLALVGVACAAVAPAAAGVAKEPQMVTFSGLVVGPGGAPMADACVETHRRIISDRHDISTDVQMLRTDAAGRFSCTLPAAEEGWASRVEFHISAEGLSLSLVGWNRAADTNATITLYEAARLAGTVVDEAGNGMPDAEVRALLTTAKSAVGVGLDKRISGYLPFEGLTVKTDAAGRFAFTSIPPDAKAELIVSAPGMATIQTGSLVERHGGFQFPAGKEDIRVVMPREAIIRGVVRDADTGKPIEGQTLRGTCPLKNVCVSGKDGAFEFRSLSARGVRISLWPAQDDAPRWVMQPVQMETEAGQVLDGLILQCHRAGVLSIDVVDAVSREPIGYAAVEVYGEAETGTQAGARTYEDGTANVQAMPGAYGLRITKPGYRDFYLQRTEVAAGEVRRLTVELMPPPDVDGIVLDPAGKPVANASVMVDKMGSSVQTDEEGGFRLRVRGGVNQRWDKEHVFCLWVEHRRRSLGIVQDLGGGRETARITLRPYRTIAGRVVDLDGNPIPGANVKLRWKEAVFKAATDADGRYEFGRMPLLSPDQQFKVTAEADGRLTGSMEVLLEEARGERVAVGDMVLSAAPLAVSGIVVDARGLPVQGAQVEAYNGDTLVGAGWTDYGGAFVIRGLSAGKVQLYLPGSPNPEPVEVAVGRTDVRLVQWAQGSRVPENPTHRVP